MNILVLHNNNVPFFLRSAENFVLDGITVDSKLLKYDSSSQSYDYDGFISEKLYFLKDKDYDLIVIPFTFNLENYLELTGLRVAAHIRLTPSWRKITTPILFVGSDSRETIGKLSKLGSIVNSYHVFLTNTKEEKTLVEEIRTIVDHYPCDDDDSFLHSGRYKNFLNTLDISAPSNYGTHHSIANEWAITRWIQMFSWNEQEPEIGNKSVLNMLYFKYLMAKEGARELFTKNWKRKHPIEPLIRGVKGKKVLYIDDEGGKGWYSLLNAIFKNSDSELFTYPFENNLSKKDLVVSLKSYIDEHKADCYLIDLRLHDDDFKKDVAPKDFTGILIADYIKKKNIGNQVVMFTASNKSWNYKEAIKVAKVDDYVIKESPEYNYSRFDTYQNFCKFSDVIQNAIKKSYIADYLDIIDSYSFLKDEHRNPLVNFVEMLALDEERTIRTNILNLSVFIESYVLDHFSTTLSETHLTSKDDETNRICQISPKNFTFNGDYSIVTIHDKPQPKHSSYKLLNPRINLGVIILALYYYFGFNQEECNLYLAFRKERNKKAHRGEENNYTLSELRKVFEKLVLKILRKGFISI